MSKKLTTEKFIEKAVSVHGNRYNYNSSEYVKSSTKIKIICFIHGVFEQRPNDHLGGQGCPNCGIKKLADNNRLTNKEFIIKANTIFNNLYDYSLIEYHGFEVPVKIICKTHGPFEQKPHKHLGGCGCQKCGIETMIQKNTKTKEEFIKLGIILHKNKYDYKLVDYVGCKNKIKIICSKHGMFEQTPDNHLQGYGCGRCGGTTILNTQLFINMSNKVHHNKYLYHLTEYIKSNKKVIIVCREHGSFKQTPNTHLGGSGCINCSDSVSLAEIAWLDYLQIPKEYRQAHLPITAGKYNYIKADAYNPSTNTVYEFNGDYWHGNPKKYHPNDINVISHKSFGELYRQTIVKEKAIIAAGYNVISIWESDWKEQCQKKSA